MTTDAKNLLRHREDSFGTSDLKPLASWPIVAYELGNEPGDKLRGLQLLPILFGRSIALASRDRMHLIVTLFLSAIVAYAGDAAAEPFQVPTSGNDIRQTYLAPAAFGGRVVGLAGLVQEIKKGQNGKPLLRVALRKPNDANTSIWIGSLVTPKAGQIGVGRIIRVLGYLSRVETDDSLTQSIVKDPLFVVGFCLVDEASKVGIFSPGGIKQCTAWQEGAMPSDLARPEANRAVPADATKGSPRG